MTLRNKTFGASWWEAKSVERRVMMKGRDANIFEILRAMDDTEYKKKLDALIAEEASRRPTL